MIRDLKAQAYSKDDAITCLCQVCNTRFKVTRLMDVRLFCAACEPFWLHNGRRLTPR